MSRIPSVRREANRLFANLDMVESRWPKVDCLMAINQGGTAGSLSRPNTGRDFLFIVEVNMLEQLELIERRALASLSEVDNPDALEQWRIIHMGRSSPLMQIFDALGQVSKEERPLIGKRANQVKRTLEAGLAERVETLRQEDLKRSLQTERLDVTLPGRPMLRGRLHPSTQILRRISSILQEMGFQPYLSRDVETDGFNFQLLNFPPHHPAREMQDSFYVAGGFPNEESSTDDPVLLRTHTSPGQIHAMREFAYSKPDDPPAVRIYLPGMCYRYEQVTARSEFQFTQVEGLAVGKQITFSDLKGTLEDFARRMYGQSVRTRFRAAHFPFTEPSAEMDIECFVCSGIGCPVCKRSGWLEVLGCGMVHPVVLSNGGYDPNVYTGFAFGMGPERMAMLRHRIEDIRYFWSNDLRFLEQF